MPTCDDFQTLAERRRRAPLDAAEDAALEAHLAGCLECRRAVRLALLTDDVLRARAASAPPPDMAVVRAGFQERHRRDLRRVLVALPAILVVSVVAFASMTGDDLLAPVAWGAMVLVVALAAFGLAFVVRPRWRRARAALAGEGDLLAVYRDELDKEIRGLRQAKPFLPVVAMLTAVVGVMQLAAIVKDRILGEEKQWGLLPQVVLFLLVWNVVVLARRVRRLPQLEREREGLGE